jgi:hypothetical protein
MSDQTLSRTRPRSRSEFLRNLVAGDFFHATAPRGESLICIVTRTTGEVIESRRITTQEELWFSRGSGHELGDGTSEITSVEPLTAEIHDMFVRLDRRYRLSRDAHYSKLSKDEVKAFNLASAFYLAHPV